jgi:hypothetical protein
VFVLLVLLVATAKNAKNALGRGGANNGHIIKLEQSRFSLDINGMHYYQNVLAYFAKVISYSH